MEASIVLTVSPDFKVKEEVSITKRLLSYQALDTDGDPRTPYGGALQTLTITKARVTTPGGKEVDCTPNALNLSTPDALVAHPELSSWQEMVVTFLGLEPGAQTELSYIREDKVAFRTTFEKKQILAWHFPIRKGTVTVRLPKGMALTYQIMNFKGESAVNAVADLMEYTFTFKDIPAFSDRDMHNGMAFLPTIYLTTTPSWEAAGNRLREIAEKYGSPDEAITKKAKELIEDATTDLDKAIAIHKFVKERFAEVEWPLQDSLLLFGGAGKIFTTGQGTNLELALLQRAMLRAAGINGELALAGPLPVPDNAPGFMPFDRAVVLVDTVRYEPCHSINALPKLGALLREKGYFHEGGGDWGGVLRGTLELSDKALKGTAALSLTGGLNPYAKNLEEEGALEEAVKTFIPLPGLKIESMKPVELNYAMTRLDVKFSGKLGENERNVRLLPESKVFLPELDPRVTVTALPIRLPDVQVSVRWIVKGAGKGEPVEFKPSMRPGELSIIRKPTEDGFTLDAELDLSLDTLPADGSPGLQAALAAWQNPVVAGVLLPSPTYRRR